MITSPVQTNEKEIIPPLQDHVLTEFGAGNLADIYALASAICPFNRCMVGFIAADKQQIVTYGDNFNPDTKALSDFSVTEFTTVADLTKNELYGTNPLVSGVPNLVFYAGIPLVDNKDIPIGTLCIWDTQSHLLNKQQTTALISLGRQTGLLVETKNAAADLALKLSELKNINSELDNFATIAAHDLKSPLNAIISLTHLLQNNYANQLDEEGNEYICFLSDAANNLTNLVTGILNYSRSSQLMTDQKELINFTDLIEGVTGILDIPGNVSLTYEKSERQICSSEVALKQILINLIDNAIRYNDKDQINIEIVMVESPANYIVTVTDNGPGIDPGQQEKIFNLFKNSSKKNKGNKMSIGLAIVKKLTEKLGGTIQLESTSGNGSAFSITLPK